MPNPKNPPDSEVPAEPPARTVTEISGDETRMVSQETQHVADALDRAVAVAGGF